MTLVQLSRNFGMEIAMSAGLDHATGDHVVLMHADLQDPPELIPDMLQLAAEEEADVVFARRIGRDESRVKRVLATSFYSTMRRLARVPYQGQAGRLPAHDAARDRHRPRACPSGAASCAGMVAWVGFKQVPIEYRRAGRQAGGGASYPALFRLAFEALTSFSDVPLSIATYVGALCASLSGVAGGVVLVLTLTGDAHGVHHPLDPRGRAVPGRSAADEHRRARPVPGPRARTGAGRPALPRLARGGG